MLAWRKCSQNNCETIANYPETRAALYKDFARDVISNKRMSLKEFEQRVKSTPPVPEYTACALDKCRGELIESLKELKPLLQKDVVDARKRRKSGEDWSEFIEQRKRALSFIDSALKAKTDKKLKEALVKLSYNERLLSSM